MKIKLFLTLIIGIITIQFSNAHALWIETQNQGKINQKHTVKVFYGEYAEQTIDSIQNWYSNVKDFELVLIGPDGQKHTLEKIAKGDYFESTFIPTKDGTYTLSTIIPAKEGYETMRFEFSSTAVVQVGKSNLVHSKLPFHIQINDLNPKANSNLEVQVISQDQPEKEREVIIMAPHGWTKTVKSDSEGKVVFKPVFSGKYIIEASLTEDKVETWNGQKIEKIWKGTSISLLVK